MAEMNDTCIGLIADSHGNLEATAEAIRILKGRGAGMLVHLGDFCDSIRHDRTVAMIRLLRENNVLAVKGNNDFSVERMLADERRAARFGRRTDDRLPADRPLHPCTQRPPLRPFAPLRLAPVVLRTDRHRQHPAGGATLLPKRDFQLLFCGHSHIPILFRMAGESVTREQVPPGEKHSSGCRRSLHRDRRRGGRRGVRPVRR